MRRIDPCPKWTSMPCQGGGDKGDQVDFCAALITSHRFTPFACETLASADADESLQRITGVTAASGYGELQGPGLTYFTPDSV